MRFVDRLAAYAADIGPDACWIWRGVVANSYGKTAIGGRAWLVHRAAYELLVGPIPEGFEIDHLCRERLCMNPCHLEAVTPRVNSHRSLSVSGVNSRKTHCVHGHTLSGENVRIQHKRDGIRRVCLICAREQREQRGREKAS